MIQVNIVIHRKQTRLDGSAHDFLFTTVYVDVSERNPRLVDFSVSQFLFLDQKHAVIRFDCAHGYLNVHRFFESKTNRTDYQDQVPSAELYEQCKKDIHSNWTEYREKYLKKWKTKHHFI
ncbi:MAG: hypothetical protein J4215_03860 [Candidatus Diapherotrites archaeon]|uniref:DUF7718 domain-containing protein n=1 Tax=Candidatus Iainarchaeum sp. TaxID=3101447 RepID=A0A8T4L4E8_9ARCH|nr:hypothetical protein [Candidatus Diapherotrites archaeon]